MKLGVTKKDGYPDAWDLGKIDAKLIILLLDI